MPISLPQDVPDPTLSREEAVNLFRQLVAALPEYDIGNAALLETFRRLGAGVPMRLPFNYGLDRYAADWREDRMERDPDGPLCQVRQAQAVMARLTKERDDAERVAFALLQGWTVRRGLVLVNLAGQKGRWFMDASDPRFPDAERRMWYWWRPGVAIEERPAYVFHSDSARLGGQDLPPLDDTLRLELDVGRARAWAERALLEPPVRR